MLSSKLPSEVESACNAISSNDEKRLLALLNCFTEIDRELARYASNFSRKGPGFPYDRSCSFGLVGTRIHPLTQQSTQAELVVLAETIFGLLRGGPVRIADTIMATLASEENNGVTPTISTRLSDGELSAKIGDRLLFGFIEQDSLTGQDLSYLGGGSGATESTYTAKYGVYGRITPIT